MPFVCCCWVEWWHRRNNARELFRQSGSRSLAPCQASTYSWKHENSSRVCFGKVERTGGFSAGAGEAALRIFGRCTSPAVVTQSLCWGPRLPVCYRVHAEEDHARWRSLLVLQIIRCIPSRVPRLHLIYQCLLVNFDCTSACRLCLFKECIYIYIYIYIYMSLTFPRYERARVHPQNKAVQEMILGGSNLALL